MNISALKAAANEVMQDALVVIETIEEAGKDNTTLGKKLVAEFTCIANHIQGLLEMLEKGEATAVDFSKELAKFNNSDINAKAAKKLAIIFGIK